MSTGLAPLDDVLGGLYWGDNVVWQLDGTPVEPFYRAIAGQTRVFETKVVVSLGDAVNTFGVPGLAIVDAAPGGGLVPPGELLREIRRLCRHAGRRLLLFESLDTMVRTWGPSETRGFFTRCCPLLLEVGAIAYWCMSARDTPAALRDAVVATTQCVLRVDERSLQVVKAEGRPEDVIGTLLHWHDEDGEPVLAPPESVDRVAASLRAIRHARELSQHDLGEMAGVTASAISQVERAERGLSLATAGRLSAALGVTIDDLLHGEDPGYRIGRRPDDPRRGIHHTLTLLKDADANLRIDLVYLEPREAGGPREGQRGTGIVAVASGLVQVTAGEHTPAIRHGEVLIADSDRISAWRNLGQIDAVAFWIVVTDETHAR
ncbi:MAG TPA: helix-turn-helix transcriptional regulator [Solirubrobacteraceae bacterium]|nr:helix-turn-helix transcriptional regulator [Solirubrobacteraceae bacterium]